MKKLYSSLKSLHKCLQSNKIEYAVIGGLAVAVWGEPRLTQDIDIKVKLDNYIIDWLKQFEMALDDTTLIDTYQKMRFI